MEEIYIKISFYFHVLSFTGFELRFHHTFIVPIAQLQTLLLMTSQVVYA